MKKIFLLTVLSSCGYVNDYLGLEDDNWGEEIVEEIIDSQIGVDIDLTPGSPE